MGPTACLLHADCLFRAGIDAYAAIDAGLRIYLCFSVFHRDCLTGAFLDAGLATSAFFFVNLCRHFNTLSKKTPQNTVIKKVYTNAMVEMLQNWPHNTKQILLNFTGF